VAKNKEAQMERFVVRLEGTLVAEGIDGDKASKIAARAREPPQLELFVEASVEGEWPAAVEKEIVKGVRIKAAPNVRLSGLDAVGKSGFAVLCRASAGGRVVENMLQGEALVAVDNTGCAVFDGLSFKQTCKKTTGGLPIELASVMYCVVLYCIVLCFDVVSFDVLYLCCVVLCCVLYCILFVVLYVVMLCYVV
jgi:hypothetical protein